MEHVESTLDAEVVTDASLCRCRCCLRTTNTKRPLVKVNKQTSLSYRDMIENCLSVTVTNNNTFPSYVCVKCSNQLQSYYKFKQMYLVNGNTLLEETEPQNYRKINKIERIGDRESCDGMDIDIKVEHEMKIEVHDNIKTEIEQDFEDSEYEIEYAESKLEYFYENVYEDSDIFNINEQKDFVEIACENSAVTPSIKLKLLRQSRGNFICDYCKKVFKRKDKLFDHIKIHMKVQKPYRCSICLRNFSTLRKINKHKLVHLESKVKKIYTINCKFCGKLFNHNYRLKDHVEVAHFGIKYFCELCKKYYSSETEHKSSHHGKSRQCHTCGLNFSSKAEFKSHFNSKHSDLKPQYYKCKNCDEAFKTYITMLRHDKAVHKGEKLMCQYCSKVFTRKDKLNRHMTIHSDKKPFKCDICQKAFKTTEVLKSHKERHTDEKKYKCDCCDKMFRCKDTLWNHKKRNEKRHACAVCGKCFARSDHRNAHEKHVHRLEKLTATAN